MDESHGWLLGGAPEIVRQAMPAPPPVDPSQAALQVAGPAELDQKWLVGG
jgi:hypothetical protein